MYKDGDNNKYAILTEYVKPSGRYVGNGLTAKRTIQLGAGIGGVVAIRSADIFCIVTLSGAIGKHANNAPFTINFDEAKFAGGVLELNTVHAALNAGNVTYEYQVL
jgi:hypothetical protein